METILYQIQKFIKTTYNFESIMTVKNRPCSRAIDIGTDFDELEQTSQVNNASSQHRVSFMLKSCSMDSFPHSILLLFVSSICPTNSLLKADRKEHFSCGYLNAKYCLIQPGVPYSRPHRST